MKGMSPEAMRNSHQVETRRQHNILNPPARVPIVAR
jgi:hypothetical protein